MQEYNRKPILIGILVMAFIAVGFLVYAFTPQFSSGETSTEDQVIAIIFSLVIAYAFLKFRKSYTQPKEEDNPL